MIAPHKPDLKSQPITHMDLDLTNDCPLSCTYCFRGEKRARVLDYETGKAAVDFLIRWSGRQKTSDIAFFGGEPLMEFRLLERLTHYVERQCELHGKNIKMTATTSMVLINKQVLDFFRRHRMRFHCSLDGAPESHDRFRKMRNGQGSSALAYRWAKSIIAYDPFVSARGTLMPQNAANYLQDVRFLHEELGFKSIMFSPAYEAEWDEASRSALRQQAALVADYLMQRMRQGQGLTIGPLSDRILGAARARRGDPPPVSCTAGARTVAVSVDGELFPCHRFPTILEREHWRLGDIWKGLIPEKRAQFETIDFRNDPACDRDHCPAGDVCIGGCPGLQWTTQRSLTRPHPNFCFLVQVFTEQARRVHEVMRRERNPLFLRQFGDANEKPSAEGCAAPIWGRGSWAGDVTVRDPVLC